MSFSTLKHYVCLIHCHGFWRTADTWFALAVETCLKTCLPHVNLRQITLLERQGFMQDTIIASQVTHVLVDTWMLTLKCWSEMDYKHTCDTIFTHFQGITNNIYGFGRLYFCPFIFLPVHSHFYPSKWRVDGSLHKAMLWGYIHLNEQPIVIIP